MAPCRRLLQLCVAVGVAYCTLNRRRCPTVALLPPAANCCARCAASASAASGCRLANWCPVPPMRMPPHCCPSSAQWASPCHPVGGAAAVPADPSRSLSCIWPQICVLARSDSGCTPPSAAFWPDASASHCSRWHSHCHSSPRRCCTCAASRNARCRCAWPSRWWRAFDSDSESCPWPSGSQDS